MQVRLEDLPSHLRDSLSPMYLISGDETLLVEEACDAVVARARERGFSEKSVHHVDNSYRWNELVQDSASMSLFAERKIIDIRVPGNKFDKDAAATVKAWLASPPDDVMLLLRMARLSPDQRKSAWFKNIDRAAVVTLIWPIGPEQLPDWIGQRLQAKGLQMEPDAVLYLSERVEGNLLAAAQEIEKLTLLAMPTPITLASLVAVLDDTSRFTSFDLIDSVMAGDGVRVSRVLRGMRQEGASLFAILGAFTSQLRRGDDTRGMPQTRQQLVRRFCARVKDLPLVLAECAVVDRQGKGQGIADAWVSLERLLLRLAGGRSLTLPSEDDRVLQANR